MGLLDRQIKQAIAAGFKGKLLKGTLRRATAGTLNNKGDIAMSTPSTFTVEGFVDEYDDFRRRNAGIPDTDLKITLIAGLIKPATRPVMDDMVMFDKGEWAGQWFKLRRDGTDPAGAAWTCQSYPVAAP